MKPLSMAIATHASVRIVAIYATIGSLWILFSDQLLELLVTNSQQMTLISMYKGWGYVALTSVMLYLLIMRYITREHTLSRELQLNQETIEHAADEVFWTDRNGRIVYANPAAIQALGYTLDELCQMTVHDLAPSFPRSVWPAHWQELKQKGSMTFESAQCTKHGEMIDVEVSTNYIRLGDEEYTAAFVRDIRERKQHQQELIAAETRFRGLLETVDLMAIMLDTECRITFCNDYLLAVTGWSRDEICGKNWFELFIPEDERPGVQSVNESLLQERLIPHFENAILTRNGNRRQVVWNNTLLRNSEGAVIGTASIGVDVTEHRQLELQVTQHQKLESLGSMAGGIAHEFNNILTVIIGNADLALHHLESGKLLQSYLQRVKESAVNAAEIARQILTYTGKGSLTMTPVDLSIVVEGVLPTITSLKSSRITLDVSLNRAATTIEADIFQLRQLLINLVNNAIEAINEMPGTITISTGQVEYDNKQLQLFWPPDESLQPGTYQFLDIADNGCGMDQNTVQRIFDPFFSTKFIGRGLGMAAVLGIVRAHSGGILVESTPGRGSSFRIILPEQSSVEA